MTSESSGRLARLGSPRGSVSIIVLAASLGLVSLVSLLAACGQLFVQQRETELAADLSALAGAQHLLEGPQQACLHAGVIARLNDAHLVMCSTDTSTIQVEVNQAIKSAVIRKVVPVVRAKARAGY